MKKKMGFALVELVIVAMILAIIAAVSLPALGKVLQHSVVFVDGKKVFDGRAYCLEVKSAGAATEINIGRGPLCLIPGDHYVSNNVKVETH